MAITTMDGLVAATTAGESLRSYFPTGTSSVGNSFSLNTLVAGTFGQLSVATVASSGGQTYTQGTTAGQGWPIWSGSSGLTYLSKIISSSSLSAFVSIYDLLWGCSGFNATLTTSQPVTAFTGLPARSPLNGVGLELWVICFTADGATASTMTVSYTNQSGTSGRTSQAVAINSMTAGQTKIIPLQNGDTGIQSVQSIILSASTTTAGNLGLFLMNRVTSLSLSGSSSNAVVDFAGTGLPIVNDSAVLIFNEFSSGGTTGNNMIQIDLAQG